jgi:tRNA modification GTPase
MSDTIIALATPMGKSGVAVLRLSGDKALDVVRTMGIAKPLPPRQAVLSPLWNPESGEQIDTVLAFYFPAPRSFTGEDVVEIHCHGSRAVIREILSVALAHTGVRHATAGEFSRRVLENGKMDLVQVEALMDLIESETAGQKSLALRQLGGDISHGYAVLRERIIEVRAFCEVFIDFPDDDLPHDMDAQINEKIEACAAYITQLLTTAKTGRQRRDGVQVAIVGVPNAGKSTLINAIAGRQVAITSPIAGTTRDAIELYQDIGGIPYRFFDTAGLRETNDSIEQQGVAIALRHAEEADAVIIVIDPMQPIPPQLQVAGENVSRETFFVLNKEDTISDPSLRGTIRSIVSRETFFVSAITGSGVTELLDALSAHYRSTPTESIFITRERHVSHLTRCLSSLTEAMRESDLVLKSEHLIHACNEVGYILGAIHIEDVLDTLFTSFCIGK